jgi:hypothetical protein
LCIRGSHQAKNTLLPKSGQTWIGVDTAARINGAATLSGWAPAGVGVWVYAGPLAERMNVSSEISPGVMACYEVSIYQDDVFCNDQRMMRVLSLNQVTGTALPPGQAVTNAEFGRFFFDYADRKIYINKDPAPPRSSWRF